MNSSYIPGEVFILGDRRQVGFKNIRAKDGSVISGCTAIASFYDDTGTVLLSSGQMTITYDVNMTRVGGEYNLTSGTGNIIITDGEYTGKYQITFPSGEVRNLIQRIVVKPASQSAVVTDNPQPGGYKPFRQATMIPVQPFIMPQSPAHFPR